MNRTYEPTSKSLRISKRSRSIISLTVEAINEYGKEGWELVNVTPMATPSFLGFSKGTQFVLASFKQEMIKKP